jgi:hypothetical protein
MDTWDERQLFERSAAAQDRLVEALMDLHESQVDAFFHEAYDPCAYDSVIDRYRQAKREAEESRRAWEQRRRARQARSAPSAAHVPAVEIEEIEPTPRLLFARWLYQSGRISG